MVAERFISTCPFIWSMNVSGPLPMIAAVVIILCLAGGAVTWALSLALDDTQQAVYELSGTCRIGGSDAPCTGTVVYEEFAESKSETTARFSFDVVCGKDPGIVIVAQGILFIDVETGLPNTELYSFTGTDDDGNSIWSPKAESDSIFEFHMNGRSVVMVSVSYGGAEAFAFKA
jgi:hypothetical protein